MKGTKRLTALATTAFVGVSLLGALPAQALMYNFAFTDVATSGSTISASGLLDVTAGVVTNISGTFNGNAITSLFGPNGFQGNDNLFSPTTPQVTGYGFSFFVAAGNQSINVYRDDLTGNFLPCSACYGSYDGVTDTEINFSASPVPIPAAVWLFGSGLIGLVGIGRRRRAA